MRAKKKKKERWHFEGLAAHKEIDIEHKGAKMHSHSTDKHTEFVRALSVRSR